MTPTLTARGEVRFDGSSGFLEEYDRNLRAGGLTVRMELALTVRQGLKVRLLLPSSDQPLDVDAEVVVVQGDVAWLQLAKTPETDRRLAEEAMTLVTAGQGGELGSATIPPMAGGTPYAGTRVMPPPSSEGVAARPGAPPAAVSITRTLRAVTAAPPIAPFDGRITRAFAAPDLAEAFAQTSAPESEIGATTVLRLLQYLAGARATGTLRVEGPERAKQIYFVDGSPVFARTDPPRSEEQIGRLLVDLGRMNERQQREIVERALAEGRRVGSVLVEQGVIRRDQLDALLRFQVEVRTMELFDWASGGYRFTPGADPAAEAEAHPIRLKSVLLKQAHRHLKNHSIAALTEMLGQDLYLFGRLPHGGESLGPYVPDLKQARVMVQLLDGSRTLRDVVSASTLGRSVTLRLVVLLRAAGVIELGAADPSAASSADGNTRLQTRIAQLETQNMFERLGVHYTSHPTDFARAFKRALAEIDETSAPDAALKQRAVALIEQAHRTLTDPLGRKRYRIESVGDDRIGFAADLLLRQAELLMLKGEAVKVREMLDVVDELRPSAEATAVRARLERALAKTRSPPQ
ncbi:MAG: DUF4388 domain-containing protein [Myxococcota bacterium]